MGELDFIAIVLVVYLGMAVLGLFLQVAYKAADSVGPWAHHRRLPLTDTPKLHVDGWLVLILRWTWPFILFFGLWYGLFGGTTSGFFWSAVVTICLYLMSKVPQSRSTRSSVSAQPRSSSPEIWFCPRCMAPNNGWRSNCTACRYPRSAGLEIGPVLPRNAEPVQVAERLCPRCGSPIPGDRRRCPQCWPSEIDLNRVWPEEAPRARPATAPAPRGSF